jgi:hypothetical protein
VQVISPYSFKYYALVLYFSWVGLITLRKSIICLSGHTLAITCVKWGGDGVIYTGFVCFSVPQLCEIFIRQPPLLFLSTSLKVTKERSSADPPKNPGLHYSWSVQERTEDWNKLTLKLLDVDDSVPTIVQNQLEADHINKWDKFNHYRRFVFKWLEKIRRYHSP